jgi:plastocyanin/FtsP/CotA-like multicopper oxidase with cupredoxin domain
MPTIDYWIQIENHPWDACPNNIDRMTGQKIDLASLPAAGGTSNPPAKPLDQDALILRRYTANWAAPDDRKVNPWDLNEPDPAVTRGTIPGPVIECDLATGDDVIVHFRNMDLRTDSSGQLLSAERRAHSLHPHGFAFAPQFDGAYPLSPQDTNQPIPAAEVPVWSSLGVTGFKQGDRVPAPNAVGNPPGTFDYHWQTIGWPTTAGVWHYHDHSICDVDNINYGAIGIIVIHNSNDPEDFLTQDLPGGSPNGSPIQVICFPPPFPIPVLPNVVELIGRRLSDVEAGGTGMPAMPGMPADEEDVAGHPIRPRSAAEPAAEEEAAEPSEEEVGHLVDLEHLLLDVDLEELVVKRFCFRRYRTPPERALYLQLYHTLGDAGVCINGRTFLGNTPTLVAGENTHMRFGVVGMGSEFHTFHLHGHRWILPGPHGTDLGTIQSSPQDQSTTQFEDTRVGPNPANSFFFTIHEGNGFMRPPPGLAVGEWHMHCHVLSHMMMGMMGSLLVVKAGTKAVTLARGRPCPGMAGMPPGPDTVQVKMAGTQFNPKNLSINRGTIVQFVNDDTTQHSATADDFVTFDSSPACSFGNLGACLPPNNAPGSTFNWPSPTTGVFPRTIGYHCRLHGAPGAGMFGTITVT